MIGSMIFGYLAKFTPVEVLARPVYLIGAISLLVPAVSTDTATCFISFLVFEAVCGMHWPLTGTLKGKYIPEESRSAVMNLMRLPLNLIVVLVLLNVASMELATVFGFCFLLVLACFVFTFTISVPPSSSIPL